MSTTRSRTHVVVLDSRTARLVELAQTPTGRLHASDVARLDEIWDEAQHGRPSPLAAGEKHSGAGFGHEGAERVGRWTREVAGWLERDLPFAPTELFASARVLGELRPHLRAGAVPTHELDIAHLSLGELESHPAIVRAAEARLG